MNRPEGFPPSGRFIFETLSVTWGPIGDVAVPGAFAVRDCVGHATLLCYQIPERRLRPGCARRARLAVPDPAACEVPFPMWP
jgi:hypothetical protein